MADSTSGPPTKTVIGPDGTAIHYPDLPNVGEPYRKPDQFSNDASAHDIASPTPPQSTTGAESWRERVMSAARSAVERVGLYGHAVVQALVLDDWKALTDAHSSTLRRVEGGVGLASWAIPEGKIAEIAGHAAVKASEIVAAHLSASGVEHVGAAATAIAASRGMSRQLTEAERSGHFASADDFKKFMGPATERGGPERDWHHIVEKTHADNTHQFPADRVHSVENMVAVPRNIHQGKGGLSVEFNEKDRRLGTSLRERLQGQPWGVHDFAGEQALRRHGLDPDLLRAETRTRFDQRLIEHDRTRGLGNEHGNSIVAPGLLLGSPGAPDHAPDNSSTGRATHWTPDMSHEDFTKLQAQIRGGSPAPGLPYECDGVHSTLRAGLRLVGTIQRVEGDQIVQHIGRGQTATWSRERLSEHFDDPKAFDAMMQPGNLVKIGMDNNGTVDAQQRLPDHSWQSLSGQQTPNLGRGLER